MHSILKTITLSLVILSVTSCAPTRNANPEIVSSEKEITIVLGVRNIHSIAMIAGTEANGEFKPLREGFSANIRPDTDYVVTQLPARTNGTRYAISQVMLKAGGTAFNDCVWKHALTFPSQGGRVIYLGDFDFRANGKQLTVEQSKNIENALAFIDTRYPNLRGHMEYIEPTLLRHAKADCESRSMQYQIYFIPARR